MIDIQTAPFKMGNIFEKLSAPYIGVGNKFDAVRKERTKDYSIPVVYAKYGDNGIMYWAKKGDFTTYENVISVVYNGVIAAGRVYPQKQATGILAESYFIKPRVQFEIPFEATIFLAKVIEKVIYPKYSREYLATWANKVENDVIELPVDEQGGINWQFMADYVKRVEADYVKRVDSYLSILGYSNEADTLLTSEERAILDGNQTVKKAKFKLEELFDIIERGKRLRADDRINGSLAFVTAGTGEMGISSYIGNDVQVFPANSLTIDMFGTVFYRGYEFGADDHVAVLHDTSGKLTRESMQYMQPVIEKTLAGLFSYSKNFYASDAIGVEVELPVTTENQLDIAYMTKFIKVIQKMTVQKVRKEMDSRLSAYQKVISN